MRKWAEEERKRQAEICRRNKPWEKSTGPRTAEGKRKTRLNAYKHGNYSATVNAVRAALKANREFLRYSHLTLTYLGFTPWRKRTERDQQHIQRLGKAPVQGVKQTDMNYFFSGRGYPVETIALEGPDERL